MKVNQSECHIHCLQRIPEPIGTAEAAWQLHKRLRRIIRRRLNYLRNWLSEVVRQRDVASPPLAESAAVKLQAGNQVRVRSKAEIHATLDRWNRLKGCTFLEEMWPYCGTTQRVLKRVEKFLDERDYRVKECRGIVLLEGAICQGMVDFGGCDRSCFFFWREEWLEKID